MHDSTTTQPRDRRGSRLVPFEPVRRGIARTVTESAAIPSFTATAAADIDDLLALRQQLNAQLAVTGGKLSVNDLLVRAAVLALKAHPGINASYSPEGRGAALVHERINVGVAVDSPAGLMVPVLHDTDQDSLPEISRRTRELADRARTRKLAIEDMSEGTFTISNLGMLGIERFDALIIPPQGAILAVGAPSQHVTLQGETPVARQRILVTITADHRIIDGALAARFLATFTALLEAPEQLRDQD